ncbi:hypothetical protein V5O48_002953 [Marasmius crinis-equi]|uniref:Uncharacterized protein n=1 Tax=Marasmius crinis-equi TaxID=585013 RepID=A0ABR3FU90_9AGAR
MALDTTDSTKTYFNDFQEHLHTLQKHLAGANDKPFSSSFIAPSGYWTPSEKERFFHSLSVHTRFRPDLIALDVKSKSATDVCIYLAVLEQASAQAHPIRNELDIAMMVPDSWVNAEEGEAERLEDVSENLSSMDEGGTEQDAALAVLDTRKMELVDRILYEKHEPTRNTEDAALDSQCGQGSPNTDQPMPSHSQSTSHSIAIPSSEPPPEPPLSPGSRRRLNKRMYMRKKRANQSGSALDPSTSKLQPGKKARRDDDTSTHDELDGTPVRHEIQDLDAEDALGSLKTKESGSEELEKEWERLGIDSDALVSRGLGLFRLGALGSLMRISSQDTDVTSSISAPVVQALDAIVKNFVSEAMYLCVILREEELRLKGQTKVWHSNDEVYASTVNHALTIMGHARARKGLDSTHSSFVNPEQCKNNELDSTQESESPSPPQFSTRLGPALCSIPETFSDSDELLSLETDEVALVHELEEEIELDEQDRTLELEYKEALEAKYNAMDLYSNSNTIYPAGQAPGCHDGNFPVSTLHGYSQDWPFHSAGSENMYPMSNPYHTTTSNPPQLHAGRVQDYSHYPIPSTLGHPPQVSYSRHPGGGTFAEVRTAHNPPMPTSTPYSSHHSHASSSRGPNRDDQFVKRNRSASSSSNPYPTHRPPLVTSPAPVPVPRPTRKLLYNDMQCVKQNSNGTPIGPSNHVIVPQLPFIESAKGDVGVRQKSIPFQLASFPELGVRVSKGIKQPLDLVGADDMVFDCIGREYSMIKFRIVWPGYPPFEKRLKTRELVASRAVVLSLVCKAINDFIKDIERWNTPIEPGFEDWEVGHRPLINRGELFVTGLIHRGCANWQPEIWCPSYRGD